MTLRHYTTRHNTPPAPWPVSGRSAWVTKHTLGLRIRGRSLVITWEWA